MSVRPYDDFVMLVCLLQGRVFRIGGGVSGDWGVLAGSWDLGREVSWGWGVPQCADVLNNSKVRRAGSQRLRCHSARGPHLSHGLSRGAALM